MGWILGSEGVSTVGAGLGFCAKRKIVCATVALLCYNTLAAVVPSEVVTLPTAAAWGGGDVVGSQLIGRTYNGGYGPGIWIVADGGYRLYLNGELLAQDNQAGRVTFVPMTFLPGTNALSVVGVDSNGAPGVLVQVDELGGTYVSGTGWKAATTVSDNAWKGKAFNDAAWASATASGSAATLPSGAALAGFAPGSTAKWVWASSASSKQAVLRYNFTIKAEGFGAATTGGDGGTIVVAADSTAIANALTSTAAQVILVPEGTYDLRRFRNAVTEATAAGRTWCKRACAATDANPNNTFYRIDFKPNTCADLNDGSVPATVADNVQKWERWITTKANKTIVGMGRGANLRGAAMFTRTAEGSGNFIARNLAVYDVNPHLVEASDGLSTVGTTTTHVSKFWADHISYKWISDGMDIEYTDQATVSWLDYDGRNQFNCYQTDPYVALLEDTKLTYANDYWHGTMGRVPKVVGVTTGSQVHVFNSYIDTNTYYMLGAHGTATAKAELLFENNAVNHASYAFDLQDSNGYISWLGNVVTSSTAKFRVNNVAGTTSPADVVFTPPYTYMKRTAANLATENPGLAGVGGKWGAMPAYNQAFGQSNKAPVITLTAPFATANLTEPATITLTAAASDADGSIAKVEFHVGNTLVGTSTASPYTASVTGVVAGTYSLVARATDNSGLVRTSDFVTISVKAQGSGTGPVATLRPQDVATQATRFRAHDLLGRLVSERR